VGNEKEQGQEKDKRITQAESTHRIIHKEHLKNIVISQRSENPYLVIILSSGVPGVPGPELKKR
jgi:hypothetical protein